MRRTCAKRRALGSRIKLNNLLLFSRSSRSRREIVSLDKWEIIPDEIEYEEELGRGAFGVVYKATLKKRQGIEVFDTRKGVEPKKADQVVAVKVLEGTFKKTVPIRVLLLPLLSWNFVS